MRRKKKNFGLLLSSGTIIFCFNILLSLMPDSLRSEENMPQSNNKTELSVEQEMNVLFLDVGQGLSILVELGDEILMYDGGNRDTSSYVVSYLEEQGITEIDYLISSHYDADHVSGLIGCLYAFDVKNVIGSNYVHDSNLYTSFMEAVEQEGLTMQYPEVGTRYAFGKATITILSPEEIVGDSNSNSMAVKLSYGESDFLFMGDADYKLEKEMITSGINMDCEVLSLSHHGSASGTSEDFLIATTPEYAVISCGKDNGYGHPHEEVVGLLEDMEVDLYRNDMQGTVVVSTNGTKLTWSEAPCNDYSDGD